MNLFQITISGAIFIIFVVVIRSVAINRLPKKTFIILWNIAIVRLLLPVSFPWPIANKGITGLGIVENSIANFTTEILTGHHSEIGNTATQSLKSNISPKAIPFIIWIVGAILLAGYFLLSYLRCHREFQTSLPVQNAFVTEWLQNHSLQRKIEIRQLIGLSTPLTYGVLHPIILLPQNTNWEEKKRVEYVLFHEYTHIRRLDSVGKLISAVALCIHWFNPMVWVLYALYERDVELSCDECVIQYFGGTSRIEYAQMLINMEEQRSGFVPFYSNFFTKNTAEERIESIMKFKRKSIFTVVLALTFVLIGTMIAFATSTPDSQGETNFSSSFNTDLDSSNFSDTIWTEGISFIDLAPGKNMTRSEKIIISPNEVFRYSITYSRPSLVLEFGLKSSDGTEYSKTITGGDDHGVIENVPAGTYELFVRNSGDYSEYPAYKDGTLSYSTTGCINFLLEVSAKNEIDIDDLVKPAAGNKLEFLN